MHEATVMRSVNAIIGLCTMPVLVSLPLGFMGLIDLGYSDDVFGVMAFAAVLGAGIGFITGLRSVDSTKIDCSECGEANEIPADAPIGQYRCRFCADSLDERYAGDSGM